MIFKSLKYSKWIGLLEEDKFDNSYSLESIIKVFFFYTVNEKLTISSRVAHLSFCTSISHAKLCRATVQESHADNKN
jgi:hypothetical protein